MKKTMNRPYIVSANPKKKFEFVVHKKLDDGKKEEIYRGSKFACDTKKNKLNNERPNN